MSKSKTKIRILLADDHKMVRSGIRQLVESPGDMEVIAEASDGEEAQFLIEEHQPDGSSHAGSLIRLDLTE